MAFTRILHRTKPDILYDEVRLFVSVSMTFVSSHTHGKHYCCPVNSLMAIIALAQGCTDVCMHERQCAACAGSLLQGRSSDTSV